MSALAPDVSLVTPRWRGLMHTWWFMLAIPAGALLIVSSEQAEARAAASIYAATLPRGCRQVTIEGTALFDCGGTYYQAHGSQYVVVYVE